MPVGKQTIESLARIPNVSLIENAVLSGYVRFGIGGPAALYLESADETGFMESLALVRAAGVAWVVIGGGSNLIVADSGFDGVVLRFTGRQIRRSGLCVEAESGADLQALVDFTLTHGLKGLETMTGIPGWVGGAVYGNAGAYGHSIMERVEWVRFFDPQMVGCQVRRFSNADCEFTYRESIFKRRKEWVIFSTGLRMTEGDAAELSRVAREIRAVRDEKYPPTMQCAGSIFKNLFLAQLPPALQTEVPAKVVREGKVPSAWFLEQVGAKGMRLGGIQVADYHANLIYNAGAGTAAELVAVIGALQARVQDRFGFRIEEEVQYVGF